MCSFGPGIEMQKHVSYGLNRVFKALSSAKTHSENLSKNKLRSEVQHCTGKQGNRSAESSAAMPEYRRDKQSQGHLVFGH